MHTQKCIVDLSVTPMGKSSSVSEEMVLIQKIIKKSGLSHQMHAEGTNIEGDWDTVFTVIRECHEKLHEQGIARISSNIRISTRTDKQQTIQGKLDRKEEEINNMSFLDKCIETLKNKKSYLDESSLRKVCQMAQQILIHEENVQLVFTPVTLVGDIHGQFYDLLHLFELGGEIQNGNKYVFLGDYVDRGSMGVETMSYLLCLKIKYKDQVTLIRGNHESENITIQYGFYEECSKKYGNSNTAHKLFQQVFQYLPISCLIDGSIFCVHGGLSPEITDIDQIRLIQRNQELPDSGPLADLMWSDPQSTNGFTESSRGAGYFFGPDIVDQFLYQNNLSQIVRAHQLQQEGYRYQFDKKLLSVWSAPNYCNRCKNDASIIEVNEKLEQNVIIFQNSEEQEKVENNYRHILPYFL